MGCRDKGARFGVPDLSEFMGEKLQIPTQGDGVDLYTWDNLHGHGSCAMIFSW